MVLEPWGHSYDVNRCGMYSNIDNHYLLSLKIKFISDMIKPFNDDAIYERPFETEERLKNLYVSLCQIINAKLY